MAYTFSDLVQLLQSAGLDSASAATGAAVALAESGGDPGAVGDAGTSFGLWQIHLPAHPDVTQACALDPRCAAAAAARISNLGLDWSPWTTWRTGAYRAFLAGQEAVKQAAQVAWKITLRFGEVGPFGGVEQGTDVGVDPGTPLLSPFTGTVQLEDKGKLDWGKRLLLRIDSGPLAGWTYGIGHMTDFAVQAGQHVDAGVLLGHSGGDPSDPSSGESDGPHVEFQFLNPEGLFTNPEQVIGQLGTDFGHFFGAGGPGLPNPLTAPLSDVAAAITSAAGKLLYLLLALTLITLGLFLLVVGSVPWEKVAAAAPQARAVEALA